MLQTILWIAWEVFVGLIGLVACVLGTLNYAHKDEWKEEDGWITIVCYMATALCVQHLYFTLT